MNSEVTIDCLQYCNWSRPIFDQMALGGVDAVHVTICYHEDFRETVANIEVWNQYFQIYSDRIVPGRTAQDVVEAKSMGRLPLFLDFRTAHQFLTISG